MSEYLFLYRGGETDRSPIAPHGNPSTDNFFSIVNALQKKTHVRLRVTAKTA